MLVLLGDNLDPQQLDAHTLDLIHIFRQAEDETVDEHYRWHIIPVLGDATASDLDPDFIATIGREGVLLYLAPEAVPPEPLRHLEPFDHWTARLRDHLATLSSPGAPTR